VLDELDYFGVCLRAGHRDYCTDAGTWSPPCRNCSSAICNKVTHHNGEWPPWPWMTSSTSPSRGRQSFALDIGL